MAKVKEAAIQVLDTMTEYDYVGLVNFHSLAEVYDPADDGEPVLVPMNAKNMALMKEYIGDLQAIGTTNFDAAFRAAFDLITQSRKKGKAASCNGALLFLTDGFDDSGITAEEVVER